MIYAIVPKKVLDEHEVLTDTELTVQKDGNVILSPAMLKFFNFSLKGIDLLTQEEIRKIYG